MPSLSLVAPGSLDQHTGGYVYDRRMADGLRGLGWDVQVIELAGEFPNPSANALDEAARALAGVASGRLVVIDSLAFGAMPDVVACEASRLCLVALVHLPLSAAALLEGGDEVSVTAMEGRALQSAKGVIVTGRAALPLLERYRLPAERVIVVEPGTDRAPIARGSHTGEPLELLCVATLNSIKGHEQLLEALTDVGPSDWRLTCVGSLTRDLETAARVRDAIVRLNLQDRVTLTGELTGDALEEHFNRADVFVLASRQETFGMAVAEALARGIPVIATATGSVEALLADDAGLVVHVGDRQALASALRRVLGSSLIRAQLAAGASRTRTRLRTWDQAATELARGLEALVYG
ncbi:MAG: glycosyltransferase family 4 protein [Acidobacteria bacterium]|nr:glycosyltransferase family 4 protein [Acidobacteriota bacterium]